MTERLWISASDVGGEVLNSLRNEAVELASQGWTVSKTVCMVGTSEDRSCAGGVRVAADETDRENSVYKNQQEEVQS